MKSREQLIQIVRELTAKSWCGNGIGTLAIEAEAKAMLGLNYKTVRRALKQLVISRDVVILDNGKYAA